MCMFCISLFVLFLLAIVLSDYPFGIFKLFLKWARQRNFSGDILSLFLVISWVFFWWYIEFVSGDILSLFLVISWVCFWWYIEFVSGDILSLFLVISWLCFWRYLEFVSGDILSLFLVIYPVLSLFLVIYSILSLFLVISWVLLPSCFVLLVFCLCQASNGDELYSGALAINVLIDCNSKSSEQYCS